MSRQDKARALLKRRLIILDGALGTELQKRGLPGGASPELWCLENKKVLSGIHSEYVAAGSDIIYTCTFGASLPKLSQYKCQDVYNVNKKLAKLARTSSGDKALVAGDIGPTGEFVAPFGGLGFEEAVAIFREQARGLLAGGADLFVVETMMDLQEARAAVLAIRELCQKPILVSMTFERGMRTLSGNDPLSCLVTLQSLGISAFGCNCSSGPKQLLETIRVLKPHATIPLIAKPNAGLPKLKGKHTHFSMKPIPFSKATGALIKAGANFVGGCCGTTPLHIAALKRQSKTISAFSPKRKALAAIASSRKTLLIDTIKQTCIVGEKINPTGKSFLKKALKSGDFSVIRELASEQEKNGAKVLDVNVATGTSNEKELMRSAISTLSLASDLPLIIDSSDPAVIEAALRFYPGRALVNSVSGEKKKAKKLLWVIKKYGAMFIVLPLTRREIPVTFSRRRTIIMDILKNIKQQGFSVDDIIVDALVMTLSTNPAAGVAVLSTIAWLKKTGIRSIMGLSNISFGLPRRSILNKAFFKCAAQSGLSFAICDPKLNSTKATALAKSVITNEAQALNRYVDYYSSYTPVPLKLAAKAIPIAEQIHEAILTGNRSGIVSMICVALKQGFLPLAVMNDILIPAIIQVGDFFDEKKYFLPQLIKSAEAMKEAVNFLQPKLARQSNSNVIKAKVILATVEGDIHDIGKNIVALLMRNHGFNVIDLGKDVSASRIVASIRKHRPALVGLSALMTTTMLSMQETIKKARKEDLQCAFMVGGAVITKGFALTLKAVYAKDGVSAVRLAQHIVKTNPKGEIL